MTIPPDAQAAKRRSDNVADSELVKHMRHAMEGMVDDYHPHVVVIFGASGNLAKRRIFPTLWRLFRDDLLPKKVNFVGYARSSLTMLQLAESFEKYCEVKYTERELFVRFLKKCAYIQGTYNEDKGYKCLQRIVDVVKADANYIPVNRLYYLALPPSVFVDVTAQIKNNCPDEGDSWSRIIIENSSSLDAKSNTILSGHLARIFKSNQIYRVNHYLCKDFVQNFVILRFGNALLDASWNRNNVESVLIMHKEESAKTRSSEQFNIIRDIMSNHLLQILSVIAMEQPASLCADDIRDEKVKVMKSIGEISTQDVVMGQYQTKDALNGTGIEVRVLFKPIKGVDEVKRAELVIGVHPSETIRLKLSTTKPGKENVIEETELDVSYAKEDEIARLNNPYERLFLDAFKGSQINLLREDELDCAWRIFNPLLENLQHVVSTPYTSGSGGPVAADEIIAKYGFIST